MQIEEEGDGKDTARILVVRAKAFEALSKSWINTKRETRIQFINIYSKLLSENLINNIWNVRLAVLDAVKSFVEVIYSKESELVPLSEENMKLLISSLLINLNDAKYSVIRMATLKSLSCLFEKTKGIVLQKYIVVILAQLEPLCNDPAIEVKDAAIKLKQLIISEFTKQIQQS